MYYIQVVDDDEHVLSAVNRLLRSNHFRVDCFTDVYQAILAWEQRRYHAIIADYKMPHTNGVSFLAKAKIRQPNASRIMLSGHLETQAMLTLINEIGLFRFITKPWDATSFCIAVHDAVVQSNTAIAAEDLLLSKQLSNEMELQCLELQEPGITKVDFDVDGSINFPFGQLDGKRFDS
jgi:FixJ family two-component response regulator